MISDRFGRPLRSLRVSVTDRCNLRCQYCMPEESYVWLARESILSFEEIERLVSIFAALGVEKVRFTGGEPLLRRDFPDLVAGASQVTGINDLAVTTNGLLLTRHVSALQQAGLGRITVSLDTLREDRFRSFARSGRHADVVDGLAAAAAAGFPLKINTVIIRGYNDDEIESMVSFGRAMQAEVRFIEYMDVGGATAWSMEQVVSKREILDRLERVSGKAEVLPNDDGAPADRFRFSDGTTIGVVASTTAPFCRSCDRARLTADGMWYLCLYAKDGVDVKALLRGDATDEDVARAIRERWEGREDRGAEQRAQIRQRDALYGADSLRADPHLEMHTRGG